MSEIDAYKSRFQRLLELRTQRDIDKRQAEASEREYRIYEAELFEELRGAGYRGRHEFDFGELGVAGFQLRSTKFGKVIDKDAAIRALKADGLDEALFTEGVQAKRLNELVRDRLEANAELPDGVSFYESKGISVTRPKS